MVAGGNPPGPRLLMTALNFFVVDLAFIQTYLANRAHKSATFWICSPEWKFLNTLWIRNCVDTKFGYFLSNCIVRSGPALCCEYLRWLSTVLWAVSGNSLDSVCFKLGKQTWRQKKTMVHSKWFLKIYSLKFCDIWQNFYFYLILNNVNFKMEVEQMNFVTHLIIITVQLYLLII